MTCSGGCGDDRHQTTRLYGRDHFGPHCTTFSLGPHGAYVVPSDPVDLANCAVLGTAAGNLGDWIPVVSQVDIDAMRRELDARTAERDTAVAAQATVRTEEREACAKIARERAVLASERRARCVEIGLPHSEDVRYHEAWSIEQQILARGGK